MASMVFARSAKGNRDQLAYSDVRTVRAPEGLESVSAFLNVFESLLNGALEIVITGMSIENEFASDIEDDDVGNASGVARSGSTGHDGIFDTGGFQNFEDVLFGAALTFKTHHHETFLIIGFGQLGQMGQAGDAGWAFHAPLFDDHHFASQFFFFKFRLIDLRSPLHIGECRVREGWLGFVLGRAQHGNGDKC